MTGMQHSATSRTRRFAACAVFSALLLASCAPAPPGGTQAHAAVIARLTAQAERWDQAIVRKDTAAIAANMADDFRQIDSDGNVETKQSFIAGLVDADLQIEPYTVDDFDVRLLGDDVALLSGRLRMSGRYKGKVFSSPYRYIDIYVRRGGVWTVVSVQLSKLPA